MVKDAARLLDPILERAMMPIATQPKMEKIMMRHTSIAATRHIRPLKDRLVLYVDESAESNQAKDLLQSVGISPYVTDGPVEPLDRKPLVIYSGGYYSGLAEIKELVDLLGFWNDQPSRENRTVFKTGD